jgi:hypothetical protein
MTPDTAEMAIVDPVSELARSPVPDGPSIQGASHGIHVPRALGEGRAARGVGGERSGVRGVSLPTFRPLARLRADPVRMAAVRTTWRALWSSRLLVWVAGVGAALAFGLGRPRHAFDPAHITGGFGWLGDLLAAPAARWDAAWYLVIAHYGYRPELDAFSGIASRSAFFPLYPLGLRAISELGTPPVLAGVLLSVCALAFALYGIHRLTTLELKRLTAGRGGDVARLAVLVTAFAPMALYFSAVYSESLYLALSVGVFWYARQGRWACVAVLGALASATRSAGLVLIVPVLIIYLYGPREDRDPDSPGGRAVAHGERGLGLSVGARSWWRLAALWTEGLFATALAVCKPRYRLRRDVLWLVLLPAGVIAYMAYLALAGGSALMPFHAQEVWSRHFVGPYLGIWDGARAAFDGARQLLSLQRQHVYFKLAGGSPFISAGHNLMLFAFLLAAIPAIVGVLRRLPLAYGAYVLAALALPLSYPVTPQPLMSLPRFLVVLFPLSMWMAAWLAARPRARLPALLGSALLLVFFVGQFSTWHWIA